MARLSLSSVEVFSLLARLGCFLQALSLAHTTRPGWRKCQLGRVEVSQNDTQVGIRFCASRDRGVGRQPEDSLPQYLST